MLHQIFIQFYTIIPKFGTYSPWKWIWSKNFCQHLQRPSRLVLSNDVSFIGIHEMCNRALPEIVLLYRHALLLHKLMNDHSHTCEWVHLNFNQILTPRQTTFMARKRNRKRVGLNAFANRVFVLHGRISLDWFAMNISTFKVHCKKEFLS